MTGQLSLAEGLHLPMPTVTVATRDWDHIVPLLTGDVRPNGFELKLHTRSVTPVVLDEPDLDGGETSLSRYVLGRIAGDERLVGVPVFLMRGFRHRCILVRDESDLETVEDLAGRRIGLTGWPDSGNTWTRAVLREAGVELTNISWYVGALADSPFDPRRLGDGPLPANVSALPHGTSLTSQLRAGRLDAIFTPFMPPGFFDGSSGVRHLLDDYRSAEREYFKRTGYAPGIHVLTLRRELVDEHPWLPSAVTEVFQRAKLLWWERRRLLADTTPWQLADLEDTAATFGADWMPYGDVANQPMIRDFANELYAQGIADRIAEYGELFPVDDHATCLAGESQ